MKQPYWSAALRWCLLPALLAMPPGATAQELPSNTMITLQRGACEKRCAVYRIVVFADGTVIYDGQHHVRRPGLARTKVAVADVEKLVRDFEAIRYFDLDSQYGYRNTEGCSSVLSDAPVAMTSIVSGDRAKAVVHHHRCVGDVPRQLAELETKIDRLAKAARWIK